MAFSGQHVKVQPEVHQVYKVIQKSSGAVGGYGHNGPVYGEVTMGAFQKIVNSLRENLEFGPESSFLDIGSGLGKPNFHVAVDPGVRFSFGIELEQLRWQLSMHNLRYCETQCGSFREARKTHSHPSVFFAQADACDIADFSPFTHIYMFDIGFPPAALVSIANAFNVSRTVKALVSFQRPLHIIQTYGFEVECISKVKTRMCGSSEGHTAYVYRALHNTKKKPVVTLVKDENDNASEIKETGSRVRRRSPIKRTRRQQTQLDKHHFQPSKRQKTNDKTQPKELFPQKEAKSECASPVTLFQDGINILTSPRDLTCPDTPSRYETWLAEEGKISGGREHRRRTAKRVLYSP